MKFYVMNLNMVCSLLINTNLVILEEWSTFNVDWRAGFDVSEMVLYRVLVFWNQNKLLWKIKGIHFHSFILLVNSKVRCFQYKCEQFTVLLFQKSIYKLSWIFDFQYDFTIIHDHYWISRQQHISKLLMWLKESSMAQSLVTAAGCFLKQI